MKKKLYREENYSLSRWSGGNTKELAIYPENAKYLDRDFIWRLSSADSDLEESSFTKLPDFNRILMVLDGEVVLAHGEERTASLKAMEQDSFDGAIKTKCFGQLKKDYNLIMRKGCKGSMKLVDAEENGKKIIFEDRERSDSDGMGGECLSVGLYCNEGYIIASVNEESEMIKEGELLVVNCDPEDKLNMTVMGSGQGILTEVIFEKQAVTVEEIPEGKTTTKDYKLAMKLFLGNNKWTKMINRQKKKGVYMLPALEKKMLTLDKFYITAIVWVIGVVLCLMTHVAGASNAITLIAVVAFCIIDWLVISPLIYLLVLPKPLSAYIKKPEELNTYERKLYEEQLSKDLHQEKLMYKYRDRSNEEYSGTGDFIRKLNKK